MAVNAIFKADFSSFTDAVNKAEADLVDLGKNAANVGKSLNRMVDSFSGRKLVQDATLMVKAIESVGGTSKLTATELQAAGARAAEAADKMRRMGIDVPPGLTRIATEAGKASKATQGFLGSLGSVNAVLGAFGASLSIGAVVNFGKELLRTADQLVKVADRTGLTTTEVQKLQYIAEQSGNSLDQMTSAVSRLQSNLAGGGKGVVQAVKDLGLNFQELRAATPFEQMEQVATALQKIEDPAARARLAIEIFGRSGAEILPTLIADFGKLGDAAPVMSDKTTRALDKAGDSLNRFGHQLKVWAAESYNALGRFFDRAVKWFFELQAGFANMTADLIEQAQRIPGVAKLMGVLGISVADLREKAQLYTDAAKAQEFQLSEVGKEVRKTVVPVMELARGTDEGAKAAKKAAAEAEKQAAAYRALVNPMRDALFLQGDINAAIKQTTVNVLPAHIARLHEFDKVTVASADSLSKLGHVVQELPRDLRTLGQVMKDNLIGVMQKIPATIQSAFTGGGGIAGGIKAIGSMIGESIGDSVVAGLAAKAQANLGGALDKFLKSGLGKFVSSAIPIVGSLLGPAITGLGRLFGFGESAAEKAFKETKKLRDDFVKSFAGGFDELQRRAEQAGVTLTALWNAKNPEAYKKAIDDINKALQFQDEAMQTLDATVQKYGFSIEELGPKFGQQKLHEQAIELLQDFQVLTAGGIDHIKIIEKMGPALQEYVQSALKAGLAIPENMRPILQSMIDQGLLVDENGEKLEDFGRINFAETLDAKFKTLIDRIGELVDAITRGLNPAIRGIPSAPNPFGDWPNEIPTFGSGDGTEASYGSHGGRVTSRGIQYFGMGGQVLPFRPKPRGTDTVPAMLTPGEVVLTKDQQAALTQKQPVIVRVMLPNNKVLGEVMIENIHRDEGGIRRVIKRVAS